MSRIRRLLPLAVLLVLAGATSAGAAAPSAWVPFAPYADMAGWPPPELSAIRTQGGAKNASLGFVTAEEPAKAGVDEPPRCVATWGGYGAYPATGTGAYRLDDVRAHRAAGGDVVVSFGGQAGHELATVCPSLSALLAQYRAVIAAYGVTRVDFDIEGGAVGNDDANALRAQAIHQLQQEAAAAGRPLKVAFTVATNPTGLTDQVLAMLRTTVDGGAALSLVNIMAMDYGAEQAPSPAGRMAEYAKQAALATRNQLRSLFPGVSDADLMRRVGITPMIGINDVAQEVFTLADAAELAAWAGENGVGMLGMWQTGRDKQCPAPTTTTSLDCSGVSQSPWAFTRALGAFRGDAPATNLLAGAGAGAAGAVRGDFDGDGRDDLAIGAPGENGGAGTVHVLRGAAAGGLTATGSQQWSQASVGIAGDPQAGDGFGSALAAGDVNGDGRADL
ncbi:MAG TPA: FG-GAP-like repeat-containing protein, partial [Solirubrobacteraceae bacterium]